MTAYPLVSDPRLFYLKDFQARRLRQTYDDFTSQPKNQSACHFFFNRLYSTEDTTDRDESFVKIYDTAKRYVGGDVMDSMAKLIVLQELTVKLDQRILDVLAQIHAPIEFDMDCYERAYALSENYGDRILQIELLDFVIRLIHRISHRFGIGLVLKGLQAACILRGDTRMVDFLLDGYYAFRDLHSIDPLAQAISERELTRLDRIFRCHGVAGPP